MVFKILIPLSAWSKKGRPPAKFLTAQFEMMILRIIIIKRALMVKSDRFKPFLWA